MTKLTNLQLDGNMFTESIFFNASTSVPSLQVLDLSRNQLSGYFSNWLPILPNSGSLLLRGNDLIGPIPVSLCQMQQLHTLDLSHNHLSGSIPSCLHNITSWKTVVPFYVGSDGEYGKVISGDYKITFFTKHNTYVYQGEPRIYMTGMDLSVNRLSGSIPTEIGDLIALHSLNLSNNLLTGHIPTSFQKLQQLESLDLSHNSLVGNIPPQIIQLHSLSTFSVAFNHLSGKIPYTDNFQTFTESSYIGNSELCGPPLLVNCSLPSILSPQDNNSNIGERESRFMDGDLFFFSCVAIFYAVGFWAIILPLLISRSWRRKYYGVVDSCINWYNERFYRFLFYIKAYFEGP
ncbi:PREDICTED: phytosulfokine receptor 1-like [Nelumbo nucifera]|uniref:Phytosulfokine receptor 1-like n=2 Tax=Nelumbo nucifera TaxID=4432 RepID=A0A1U8A4S6_NELNU|nr:PREDICTED: phytosulfokine receptor 1-like [Nelumbo nucifera]DAD39298.1 TPA_asm: hypothetical protein HUJ06_013621 [Nelumbo nucifera]